MENSAQGLSMLEPEHKVVVTGEEHHQADLARWAPRADGRPRRVAAELGFVTGPRGRRVIEVRVDGRRVGILTVLMSERYAPHVFDVQRRGGRPGCVAMVVHGRRGLVEVQVYLPEVARDGTALLPPAPLPTPAPARPGARPGAGPGPAGPGRGRRLRRPLWVGAGVLAALVVVGGALGDRSEEVPTVPAAAPSTTRAALPTPTRAPATPSPSPSAGSPVGVPQASVASAPTTRATQSRAPVTAAASPAPRTTTRAPAPEPARAAVPERAANCHPSYSPCLPDGPDLDCGDVDGPVSVTGPDEYRLDADDDGIGCE